MYFYPVVCLCCRYGDMMEDISYQADEEFLGSAAHASRLLSVIMSLTMYIPPFLVFPGTIGNIFCIITLQTKTFHGSSTAFLLTMLALADIMCLNVGALHKWLGSVVDFEIRTISDPGCRIHVFLTYLSVHVSAWTLVLVTMERVISVMMPLRSPSLCSRSRVIWVWIGMLITLISFNSIYLIKFTLIEETIIEGNRTYSSLNCDLAPDAPTLITHYQVWSDLIVSFLLPAFIIVLGNAILIYKLAQIARRKKQMQGKNRASKKARRSGSTITLMLVVVCVVFMLTALPINIYLLYEVHNHDDQTVNLVDSARKDIIYTVLSQLYYVNNAINFVLYFASGPLFRRAAMELYCCKKTHQICQTSVTNTNVSRARGGHHVPLRQNTTAL